MTNRRSTRYHIEVTRTDGSKEVIQANSRRVDALRRAKSVADNRIDWPSVVSVAVLDTMSMDAHAGRFDRLEAAAETKIIVGLSENTEAEYGSRADNAATMLILVDNEVIAIEGYPTLDLAIFAAREERCPVEIL